MASSTIAETDHPLATMEAKMIVATGRDQCQQLKDVVSKEDPSSLLVVVASGNQTSTPPNKPGSPSPAMDPGLLAVARSGSSQTLESFLNGEGRRRSSSLASGDEEAFLGQDQEPLLDGVTAGGDTALHVVAGAKGDSDEVLKKARLIYSKAGNLLFVQNNKGDTPLHCAAREGSNVKMVSLLIDLAKGQDNNANRVKALLETENKRKWTVLHEAVQNGQIDHVELLMEEDPQLASFQKDDISPMYLAILLERKNIAEALYEKSGEHLSYSGPNGQNALHAAVLRGKDLTKMLLGWNKALTMEQDENGSTPLHLAESVPVQTVLSRVQRERRTILLLLLEADPDVLYQPDKDGLFPIHVAASIGATSAISDFLKKSPGCADLRDARGRTFLHVAVDKMKARTVSSACINQSLSWIMNMQDNDGNSALHLAVQKGGLRMFCALLGNMEVQLNLTNDKGETPLDIALRNVEEKAGLYYIKNSEEKIRWALNMAGAERGICRHDYLETDEIVQARQDEIHKVEILKDSTQNLCVGSVLIATVTFGATFAMPGGYRADDHPNGGTPTLSGRYAFDAFILANALAFVFSVITTISLMSSGSPMYNLRSRVIHLGMASSFMFISVTSLVAAFALGTYMMLAPVAHKAAVTVCVLSSFVLLYANLEVSIKSAMVTPPALCRRLGICLSLTFPLSVLFFMVALLLNLWPIVVILGLPASSYPWFALSVLFFMVGLLFNLSPMVVIHGLPALG